MLGKLQLALDHIGTNLGLPVGGILPVVDIKSHEHTVPEPSLAPKVLFRKQKAHVLVHARRNQFTCTLHGVVYLIRIKHVVILVGTASLDVQGPELFQVCLDRFGRAHPPSAPAPRCSAAR